MTETILKLIIPKEYTFEQIIDERNKGGKFITYSYLIPLPFFRPVKRISDIYYIKPNEKESKYSFWYNFITLFWGWWGLPFGPAYTYFTVKKNNQGTDISDDVYDNLTEFDFQLNQVIIKKISSIFLPVEKSDFKNIENSFNNFKKCGNQLIESPIVGYYIDTENLYFIIGLNKEDIVKSDTILSELHKIFYKHIRFDFIDMNDGSEFSDKLKIQGTVISY